MFKARIIGLGSYLPKKVLTNQDLEKMVNTNDEWITSRTGIKERRIAHETEFASDMGVTASRIALQRSGLTIADIDLILVATMSPDYLSPSTASLIQTKIGADKIPAMDIQAACTGFLYSLSMVKAYIESGLYKNILLVATEKMSALMDYQDRNTCILFGDGAAAAVVSGQGAGLHIDKVCLGADGELANLALVPSGGACCPTSVASLEARQHFFRMEGKEVFKHAVRRMTNTARDCIEKSGLSDEQINWFIPHQANERIIDAIAKNFNLSNEKVYKTVHKYGNTAASSVAIALDELMQEKNIKTGENLLLVAFGAGLTWGASTLKMISH